MQHSQENRKIKDTLFKQAGITLLNEKQWSYIRKRYRLTARELQIAKLICKGLNNAEIAKILDIRHGTVKTHLRNVYRRVRVKSKILMLLHFLEDTKNFTGLFTTEKSPIQIIDIDQQKKSSIPATDITKKQ